ncbi:MAG: hypothetical protein LAO23_19625 [Acidobacteriia bacterium]|nr:hypothetical protein [Terriglobia bacterium]
MILDKFVCFTGNGAVASGSVAAGNTDNTDSPTTGTQVSSQLIDLHMAGIPVLGANVGARDIGIGDDPALKLNIQVTVAFGGGTSLITNLQGAPDNGSGAAGSFTTFLTGATVLEANLTPGQQLLPVDVPRPPQGSYIPRFLQLQYVTSGTHTSGKLFGGIVLDRIDQPWLATNNNVLSGYPAGIVINN